MKYGYVTLLSSATYLPGVIALARSLRETGTKISFECVCSKNINAEVIDTLHYHKIKTHQLEYSVVDNLPISNSPEYSHWNYTFDKLFLWDMKEYDKIVFWIQTCLFYLISTICLNIQTFLHVVQAFS